MVKSIGCATPSDWQAGQRFTLASWTASAKVLLPAGAEGFATAAAGGEDAGFGGVGATAPADAAAAVGAGGADAAVAGLGAAADPVAGAAGGVGFGGTAGKAAGFAATAEGVGAAGVAGLAGRAGAGGGVGTERSSSHIAAQTPQVWILLVDALQAWAPQFGQ